MLRLALFQPDIPTNTGTILRLGACLGVQVDVIEPCGFPFSDRALRRAGLDYLDQVQLVRHPSWAEFTRSAAGTRIVLLTTKATMSYVDFAFEDGDILLLGRESAGVPDFVHDAVAARVAIPVRPPARSLNVAVAASMVVGEALRQTGF